MKLERSDWLVADEKLRSKAGSWWAAAAAGLACEAALLALLLAGAREGGWWGVFGCALLAMRAICGSIGTYCWFIADQPPAFWGFKAKWIMQFMPWSVLAWRRRVWMQEFIGKISRGDADLRIQLAGEQRAYYVKGSGTAELGDARREMACWAAAVHECLRGWKAEREAEKMKSPNERSRVLAEMGLGRENLEKSLRSLERLEIAESSSAPGSGGAKLRL